MKTARIPRDKLYHEQDCAEVYTALYPVYQELEWIAEEYMRFRPDRTLKIFGKTIYIEMERGTQGIEKIQEKVNNYKALPGTFYVVFVVKDYQPNYYEPVRRTAEQAVIELLTLFKKQHRANQFVVVPHDILTKRPTEKVLLSPLNEWHSFESIT